MFHVTSSTGLAIDTLDPATAAAALRREFDVHLADGPVSWTVTIDGLPGKHTGRIEVPDITKETAQRFIADHYAEILTSLTADYHATQRLTGATTSAVSQFWL